MEHCGAKTKGGGSCMKPAGWGTDHNGEGRCKLHGGNAAVKHGRYVTQLRGPFGEAVKAHLNDPNPLDMTRELAMLRGHIDLLTGQLGDQKRGPKEDEMESIRKTVGSLQRLADTISKIQTREALTTSELRYIVGEFVEVLRREVEDVAVLERIMDHLERRIVVRAVPLLTEGVMT